MPPRQVRRPLVQVHGGRAVEDGEPAEHQLLADPGRLGLDQRGDGAAVDLSGQQRLDIAGITTAPPAGDWFGIQVNETWLNLPADDIVRRFRQALG